MVFGRRARIDTSDPEKGGRPQMLTRMLGSDADLEFAPEVLDAVRRAEAAFPSPDYVVVYADAEEDDDELDDTIMICKRYGGVMVPMVYVTLDEIDALEAEGTDWVAAVEADLRRTDAEIEAALVVAEETGE
jgi:hypothetical protein